MSSRQQRKRAEKLANQTARRNAQRERAASTLTTTQRTVQSVRSPYCGESPSTCAYSVLQTSALGELIVRAISASDYSTAIVDDEERVFVLAPTVLDNVVSCLQNECASDAELGRAHCALREQWVRSQCTPYDNTPRPTSAAAAAAASSVDARQQ